MSSPAATIASLELSDPAGPPPIPSGVPQGNVVGEGPAHHLQPPSDVPDVEETEPPTVLDNPLITDDTGQPEAEETKEDSADRVTTTTVSSAPAHVTECATVYSIFMACITSAYTAVYAYYARTGDEKVYKFWTAIILPLSGTAMAISFVLKPRREDQAYKAFLVLQYVLFTLVTEILAIVGDDFAKGTSIRASLRSVLWLALFKFGMKCRSHIATLSDEDLSNFLTNDVIFGGALIGLGQLAFLMFASVQCDGNAEDWSDCNRTLISQAGLSGMVTLYTIIKLASGVVPKRILEKHVLSPKKLLAMDMNTEEAIQAFGLLTAVGCALYSLGNYGAEGNFRSTIEKYAAFTVPSIGGFCLLLTAVWKMVVITGELRRERVQAEGGENQDELPPDSMLVEGSSLWFYAGVLATTFFSAVNVAAAVTMDMSYKTVSMASLPVVALAYLGSTFCQPRRRSPKDMWKLRVHGASFAFLSEGTWVIQNMREGDTPWILGHLVVILVLTILFHFGLKLRAAVGRLPDSDLETFLVDTLFKGSLKTLFSILFLTFRTTKCMFEKESALECSDSSWCSTTISIYLLFWWGTKLVQGSVRSEWQKDLNLSIERIATLRDISLRRGVAGFLTLVSGICAIFLFAMMSANDMDGTTIECVGITGVVAIIGVLLSEVYSTLKAQDRRIELSESGQIVEQGSLERGVEEPVGESSWAFVGVCFLFTSTYSVMYLLYGVTLEEKYMLKAYLILPIALLSFLMAVVCKPKRTDIGYKRFLFFHFFTYVIISDVGAACGHFRLGLMLKGCFNLCKIPLWFLAFWLGLKLRESASKLPPQGLSDFLCHTVLVKGTAAMSTMLFFSFETVSCFISQNSLDNGQCSNTSTAAMYLSVYLAIITTLSIANKAVSKNVQRETAWELSMIASLKGLKWWQPLQGGFVMVTALVSLYFLSILGVEGDKNSSTIFIVGGLGGGSLVSALIIGMTMLVRNGNVPQDGKDVELFNNQRSVRGFSAGDVEENALALAMV